MRDRSANGLEFLLAKAEKERRELRTRVEEHLLLHLDYSPQKARIETVVIQKWEGSQTGRSPHFELKNIFKLNFNL